MTRSTRHIALAGASSVLIVIISFTIDSADNKYLFSMATAYTGLLLLAATLLIGPLNLIKGKINPVSDYFRRDIGIWAAIISIIHVIIGLQVHMGGRFLEYFFHDGAVQLSAVRYDSFGLANYSGLLAALFCILLMTFSNNVSLKKLGAVRWKNIQRINYLLWLLVVGHGFLYQILEKRHFPYAEIVGLILAVVLWFQWRGYKLYVREKQAL